MQSRFQLFPRLTRFKSPKFFQDLFNLGMLRLLARILFATRFLIIASFLTAGELGSYAKLSLVVFYFSFLEFGALNELERALPHYQGLNSHEELAEAKNRGWSCYFTLSMLGAISLLLFYGFQNEWHLGILLAAYLLIDKCYRAYESYSRVCFDYTSAGAASAILGLVSLIGVFLLLPLYKVYGVFYALSAGVLAACFFLKQIHKLNFEFHFNFKRMKSFLIQAFPFSSVIYSIDLYQNIGLTVLAFYLSQEFFGYYAFAFRATQTLIALFPYAMQESMRSKIFFHVTQTSNERERASVLLYPIKAYSFLACVVYLIIYLWISWVMHEFFPQYVPAILPVKILTISLLPMGIAGLCSDFLSSKVYGQAVKVAKVWIVSGLIQIFFLIALHWSNALSMVTTATTQTVTTFLACAILSYMVIKK